MRLCVTAAGSTIEASTDPSFGRAPWFLLVDTDTLSYEAIQNNGLTVSQGAGIAAAQLIKDHGAEGLLTGRVGPKAMAALDSCNIEVFEGIAACSVKDVLLQFQAGKYGPNRKSTEDYPQGKSSTVPPAGIGGGGRCREGSGMRRGMRRRGER